MTLRYLKILLCAGARRQYSAPRRALEFRGMARPNWSAICELRTGLDSDEIRVERGEDWTVIERVSAPDASRLLQ